MKKKGFTLIELLVVISIIGLLSSVVLTSLNSARGRARDARRISEIRQLQSALEVYYSKYNSYPALAAGGRRENSCFGIEVGGANYTSVPAGQWGSALNVLVTEGFYSALPRDPENSSVSTSYPYKCYQYVTPASAGTYGSCHNIQTGQYEAASNYQYVLYFQTERNPTSGFVINWTASNANVTGPITNFSGKPYNNCVFGPRV